MKHVLLILCALFSISTAMAHQKVQDPTSGIYYLKTGDGHENFTISTETTFKCVASGTIPSYRDAGVCFTPAVAGDMIQITIENIDIDGTTNFLLLYNGSYTTGYPMPSGWSNKLGAANQGQTFLSQSADGKMTLGFHSGSPNGQAGWTIKVRSVTPSNMEFVSCGSSIGAAQINRGARNQVLLNVNVQTSGINNPLSITQFNFNSSIPAGSLQSLKLYSGNTLISEISDYTVPFVVPAQVILAAGGNQFQLRADVQQNTTTNTPLAVSLTSVTVSDIVQNSVTTPTAASVISNTVLIQSTPLSYTVGEVLNFYDDGGNQGKISANFNGQISFVPSTVGKKIKIDFSRLEIFNTSSVGYNDVFKFYNGQAVDETKLNTTLLRNAEIIKSTADDGSLTVSLSSTTGVPANGWEAVVSEFTPDNMTFASAESAATSLSSTSAGNRNEALLIFNVKTDNTLNPLNLQSVKLDAAGSTSINNISNVRIYALGKTNTFNTNTLVGELAPTATEFVINGTKELTEGNNYFAVSYDIAANSLNTNTLQATLKSITVSGTEHILSNQPTATLTVANRFEATAGNFSKSIFDEWEYSDMRSPYQPTLYNFELANCQVTFTPEVANSVAELEFSAFDVYYSNSSMGTKAVFEVYSGNTTDAANLIWKLDDNSKSKTGPGRKLRSTATNGAMTIKFNANTTSSGYAGTGWKAKVRPFLDRNMAVDSIVAFQTNTDNLAPSASNQEIIGIELTTTGTLNPLTLESVKLNLKNSLASVSKVNVLYSGTEKNFANATVVGSSTNPTTAELNIAGNQAISEGKIYFWISYDIKNEVQNNQVIDAELISFTLNNSEVNAVKGNPEGQRLTKNEIILSAGNNGQVTLTQSRLFYDNGGANAAYLLNFDGQVTFMPANEGDVVKLKFNSFNTYSSHYMYVYAGTEVNADKLLAKVSGTTLPAQLISNADNGAVTIRFVSTSSGSTNAGWEAELSSYTPQARFVESVSTSQEGGSGIMRGAEQTPVQKIVVKVSGDRGIVSLSNLTFNKATTTNLPDITKATLYYTGKSSGFIDNNSLGENTSVSNQISFDISNLNITESGDYNFWLAYNLDRTATAGNQIGANLLSITANNNPLTDINVSAVVNRVIKTGFSGIHSIGRSSTANYPTFAAAIAAMQGGIEGPVRFNVETGTYAENILVSNIDGTSAGNTITFASATDSSDDVIITGSGYSEPAYGGVKYGMVCVEGTTHVGFENLSFIPTSQTYPYNVHIRNTSRYFTLRNCKLTAGLITSGYSGMNQFYMESLNVEGKNSDYATIEGNTVTGGYIGLYMGGTGYVALTKQQGAIIRNNRLINQASKAIYLMDERNATIEKNNISSATTQKTDYQAIDIYRCKDELIIRNNVINISQAYYSKGISLRSEVVGKTDVPVLIYNNAISVINSPNASTYGIAITDDCSNIRLYYNTIHIAGTGGYCFAVSGTKEAMRNMAFSNNLLQNKTTTAIYSFNKQSQRNAFSFSNNAYLLTGQTFSNNWGADFTAWATGANEANSRVETASFLSDTDLHLTQAGQLNNALPLNFITTDADNKMRNATQPTIGAYEFETIVAVTPEMDAAYPQVKNITYQSAQVAVKYNESGKLYHIILPATDAAPDVATLLAQNWQNINKNDEVTLSFNNLNQQTSYKVYSLVVSALNLTSSVASTDAFTTPRQILPLNVTIPSEWGRFEANSRISLYPVVSGGVYPYQYQWKNDMNQTLGTDSVLTIEPSELTRYTLTVTSSNQMDTVVSTVVYINGVHRVADFENLYLAPESYWQGPAGNTQDNMESKFYSGSYAFSNTYYPDWNYWGGYAYSNQTSTAFNPANMLTEQFRSVVGHGVNNSANYAVVYGMGARTDIDITQATTGAVIPGVYLTNAAYTYQSMINGDSFMGNAFTEGDWYKVTFKGTKTDGTIAEKEIYLADYRSANASERYTVTDWRWFELSSLGAITKLTVSADGSRRNSYGLTIPVYFCMDNLGAEELVTGIDLDNKLIDSNIQVYPNPFVDFVEIMVDAKQTLKIYNLSGQCVFTTVVNKGTNRIKPKALAPGMYMLQCGNKTIKINKN